MIDFTLRNGAIDSMLTAAKTERPQAFEKYAPYFVAGPALMNESERETPEISAGAVLPNTGYIHITDVCDPVHTIWLVTSDGLKIEKEFHYVGHAVDVWHC